MRLFIALTLPNTVIKELEAVQQQMRRSNSPQSRQVRWVVPKNIHLTLQFLGEVADDQVPSLVEAVEALHTHRLPALHLAEVGAFPSLTSPNVVWVGVAGEIDVLKQLQVAVVAAMEPHGFTPDKGFHPHLTLGRVRRETRSREKRLLGEALQRVTAPNPCDWQSGPPVLYRSTLAPSGSVYQPLSNTFGK